MKIAITCPTCGVEALKESGAVNRARRASLQIYCSRDCAGVARRKGLSDAQRREAKRLYDAKRRVELADRIKAEKAARHKRTYDPVKAAEVRAARMPYHVEYCRQPAYIEWKRDYDRNYRAKKEYGPFWECFVTLLDLQNEVLSRASRYEIDLQNGKLNKSTRRKRDYVKSIGG